MKKLIAALMVLVTVFSFSAVALAAASPQIPVVRVTETPEEGMRSLRDAAYSEIGEKVAEGEVLEEVLIFSYKYRKTVQIRADVRRGDKVVVLFRSEDGTYKVLNAWVVKYKIVQFRAAGKGDYLLARIVPASQADASKLIPRTGDSYRLAKLMGMGLAAIAVMTFAGIAIKRSGSAS